MVHGVAYRRVVGILDVGEVHPSEDERHIHRRKAAVMILV